MAFSSIVLLIIVVATTIVLAGASNQYKVGGAGGWRAPDGNNTDMYNTWASGIRFQLGDSIVFQYQNDSVVKVDKRGYYHCNESGQGEMFKDGNTVFVLDRPGFYYFVSGDPDRCKKGERLMVQVMDPRHSPSSSGSPSPSWSTVPSLQTLVALGASLLWLGVPHVGFSHQTLLWFGLKMLH